MEISVLLRNMTVSGIGSFASSQSRSRNMSLVYILAPESYKSRTYWARRRRSSASMESGSDAMDGVEDCWEGSMLSVSQFCPVVLTS